MYIITGAAGFIGSFLCKELNNRGIENIILVDDFSNPLKNKNLENLHYQGKVHRDDFFFYLLKNTFEIDCIFHIGARTDTTLFDKAVFDKLNLDYSKDVWRFCTKQEIPLIYASSAATYGMGEHGYDDDQSLVNLLKPLNPYGVSKNEFDKWVLMQTEHPPFWAGLKFFNVYGPNEYHKGRMASVIFHAFNQIIQTEKVRLFRSHNPEFEDGKQLRDFIFVKDVAEVILYMINTRPHSGIYNLGTGHARTFLDLAKATFDAMNKPVIIEFIDTPADIRDKYQYFTEAKMEKLITTGYSAAFTDLETGIRDYVTNYLLKKAYY